MQLEITRKFQKQVSGCNDKKVKSEIKNLKKLKGYKNYFRIRLGDYRIGIQITENKIIFAAFDKRADIYKYFP